MRSHYLGKAISATPRRRGSRAFWIVPPCLALGLGCAAFLAFCGVPAPLRVWEAATVEVRGNRVLLATEVREAAALGNRPGWLFLDTGKVRARLNRHPWIASVEVRRIPWRTLRLEITERVPEALVPHRDGLAEVDADGVLLPLGGDRVAADLPTLTGLALDTLRFGARVPEPRVLAALDFLGRCRASHREVWWRISEVRLGEPGLVRLVLQGFGAEVWLRPGSMGDGKLAVLQAVLPHLEKTMPEARVIDLRFRDQVVVEGGTAVPASAASPSHS
ncbi:MAG: FtsQ-type POTRA domain-containing protein [Candidatus Eisenbacteria bacterium]|nr:FtsQ-type POTRA domain-containing protein [Candidatus Eisenbacteria bacterium]